eukprot:1472505-Rhodomonas_salina.1
MSAELTNSLPDRNERIFTTCGRKRSEPTSVVGSDLYQSCNSSSFGKPCARVHGYPGYPSSQSLGAPFLAVGMKLSFIVRCTQVGGYSGGFAFDPKHSTNNVLLSAQMYSVS